MPVSACVCVLVSVPARACVSSAEESRICLCLCHVVACSFEPAVQMSECEQIICNVVIIVAEPVRTSGKRVGKSQIWMRVRNVQLPYTATHTTLDSGYDFISYIYGAYCMIQNSARSLSIRARWKRGVMSARCEGIGEK